MFFINSTKQNAGVLGWPLKILNCRHSKVFLTCSVPLYPNGHISLAFCASSQIFLLESHKAVACPVRTLSVHCNTIATMATTFGRTHYPQRCQPLETYNLETVYFAVPPTSNTPCLHNHKSTQSPNYGMGAARVNIVQRITETRPFKNVDRENANKWKMTLI